jgi:nucleotide-binding universal stress UspA family protein
MAGKIITGVDDSETALQAARRAAVLAEALRCELHVLSAYGASESKTMSDGLEKVVYSHLAEAERTASEVSATLRGEFPQLTIEPHAAEGKPAEALVGAAEALGAELIVVGNKRVQGPSRILGSIARSVASTAPCDLYVVNTHER